MNIRSFPTMVLLALGVALSAAPRGYATEDEVVVNAKTFNGYTRQKLDDGSLKTERYGFAEGGAWDQGKSAKTVEQLSFDQVAAAMVGPLKARNYLPSNDPKQTDLLIVVYWGATLGADDLMSGNAMAGLDEAAMHFGGGATPDLGNLPSQVGPSNAEVEKQAQDTQFSEAMLMEHADQMAREHMNVVNAPILGFVEDYNHSKYLQEIRFPDTRDTVQELQASRYFVVLKAFDFKRFLAEKKLRPLWEARFSIYRKDKVFADSLENMAQRAGGFFGSNTHGLSRVEPPAGTVHVGPAKVIDPRSGK